MCTLVHYCSITRGDERFARGAFMFRLCMGVSRRRARAAAPTTLLRSPTPARADARRGRGWREPSRPRYALGEVPRPFKHRVIFLHGRI